MRLTVVLTAALLAGGVVIAVAAGGIPGPNGVIQGCYKTATGDLRVVIDPTQCKSIETPLSWSETGPTGPSGPIGPTGATGPRGLTWRGAYSPLASYARDDAVESAGSAYIAIAPVTSTCTLNGCLPQSGPPNPSWSLLASKGDTGAAGPAGPQGPQGLTWRGTYSLASSYGVNDAVQFAGSSYIATTAISPVPCATGACLDPNIPGTSTKWQLLAAQGATGATGPSGSVGTAASTTVYAKAVDLRPSIAQLPPAVVECNNCVVIIETSTVEIGSNLMFTDVMTADLPAGSYLAIATVSLMDDADFSLQNNSRRGVCELMRWDPAGDGARTRIAWTWFSLGGFGDTRFETVTLDAAIASAAATRVAISCQAGSGDLDHSHVWALRASFDALAVGLITNAP